MLHVVELYRDQTTVLTCKRDGRLFEPLALDSARVSNKD